jgi:hypothetical protein
VNRMGAIAVTRLASTIVRCTLPRSRRLWRRRMRSTQLIHLFTPIPLFIRFAVRPFVDRRDLVHPPASLRVLERQHRFRRPMKVIGDEGYLPVQRRQGVAYDPPNAFISTTNSCAHLGHAVSSVALPLRLIRL